MGGENISGPTSDGSSSRGSKTKWPWWMKWTQKAACVIAGLICGLLGIFCCITIHGMCIIAGILQIFLGVVVLILEAPCCCSFLDFADHINKFSDSRPPWQKATVYCVFPIAPIALCPGTTTVLGNGLVFACGLSFAFMALGKKASREQMLLTARYTQLSDKDAGSVQSTPASAPSSSGLQVV